MAKILQFPINRTARVRPYYLQDRRAADVIEFAPVNDLAVREFMGEGERLDIIERMLKRDLLEG